MNNSELLVAKIVETIKGDENLSNIQVECNTEVEGRTASYPVDVFLNFYAENGINYKILINLQHVDEEVDKNQLFHFVNVIQDISGQVMGVVFTQPIYDKLVKDVAKEVGLMLYEMRNLANEPIWEAGINDVKIDVDKEWVKKEKERLNLEDTPIQSGGHPKYLFLYENDMCVDTIEGIFNEHVEMQRKEGNFETVSVQHSFEGREVFLKTDNEAMSLVKLNGIDFKIVFRNVSALDGEEIVNNILRTAIRAKLN